MLATWNDCLSPSGLCPQITIPAFCTSLLFPCWMLLHPSLAPFSDALGIELWRNVQFCKIQLSLQGRGKKEIIGAIQSSTRAVWRRYRPRSVFWLGNLNSMCANDLNSESCLGILLNIHEYPVSICSMLILLDLQESILSKDRWPVRQPKRRLVLFWNPPNPWHQGVSMVWIGVLRFGIFSKFFSNQTQNGKQIFQTFGDVAPLQRSDEMSPPSQRQASIDYPIGYDWIEVGCFANRAFTL